jgi:hypothetical protein
MEHTMLNLDQVATVNKIMLKSIANYCAAFGEDTDSEQLEMYADDVAYNANALVEFNNTKDWQALYDSVYEQDTIVREEFMDVLDYLETNALAKSAY